LPKQDFGEIVEKKDLEGPFHLFIAAQNHGIIFEFELYFSKIPICRLKLTFLVKLQENYGGFQFQGPNLFLFVGY
jgi:hypothetical protein